MKIMEVIMIHGDASWPCGLLGMRVVCPWEVLIHHSENLEKGLVTKKTTRLQLSLHPHYASSIHVLMFSASSPNQNGVWSWHKPHHFSPSPHNSYDLKFFLGGNNTI